MQLSLRERKGGGRERLGITAEWGRREESRKKEALRRARQVRGERRVKVVDGTKTDVEA